MYKSTKIINSIFYFISGISLLTSCSVTYIKTTDVQQEFKLIKDKLSESTLNKDNQFDDAKQLIVPYKICSDTAKNIQRSSKLINEIGSSLSQIKSLKTQSEQEYSNFISYTNGKTIIVPQMPEWQKIEQTRKTLNEASVNWDKSNANFEKQNNDFKRFVKDTLTPSIHSTNISDFLLKQNNEISSLENKISNSTKEFTTLKSSINDKLKKYKLLFPDIVKKIETELSGLQGKYDNLMTPINDLKKMTNDFSLKTKGVTSIVSCQKEWKDMLTLESKKTDSLQKIGNLEKEISDNKQILDLLLSKLK